MSDPLASERPLPTLEGLNGDFHRHCAEGRLAFQACCGCGTRHHPPRMQCPRCGSSDMEWVASSGQGKIFTWTVTHQALHPAFADEVPYAVVVTELEEGVRLVSGIRDMQPADLEIGLPVEVVLERVADGVVLPFVRPRSAAKA